MRTTLRDVALASGVSAVAVSKVLHGTGESVRVSAETAEKIKRVAKELSYRPNRLARSLRYRKTSTVGVVFQHFDQFTDDNPYHPQLLNGVMRALFPKKFTLALCPSLITGDEPIEIDDGRFDGVLWARPDFSQSWAERIKESQVPLVTMHAPPGVLPGVSTFCIDNEMAMGLVVDHLVSLGHRKITFVADPVNEFTTEGIARSSAFRLAVDRANVEGFIWFWDETVSAFAQYRREHLDRTAFAAFSDMIAFHVLAACEQLEIQVPDELSLVGFDSSGICEGSNPPLTSVRQEVAKMAFEATTHLLDLIEGEASEDRRDRPVYTVYPCSLDVRSSTQPPNGLKP